MELRCLSTTSNATVALVIDADRPSPPDLEHLAVDTLAAWTPPPLEALALIFEPTEIVVATPLAPLKTGQSLNPAPPVAIAVRELRERIAAERDYVRQNGLRDPWPGLLGAWGLTAAGGAALAAGGGAWAAAVAEWPAATALVARAAYGLSFATALSADLPSDENGGILSVLLMGAGAAIGKAAQANNVAVRAALAEGEQSLPLVAEAGRSPAAVAGPGRWVSVREAMSPRAAAYQARITGQAPDKAYVVEGVRFDGFKDGVLLDAKGPGYATFVRDGAFRDWWRGEVPLLAQARSQIAAAAKGRIEWHFAEPETAEVVRRLFKDNGVVGIQVIVTP